MRCRVGTAFAVVSMLLAVCGCGSSTAVAGGACLREGRTRPIGRTAGSTRPTRIRATSPRSTELPEDVRAYTTAKDDISRALYSQQGRLVKLLVVRARRSSSRSCARARRTPRPARCTGSRTTPGSSTARARSSRGSTSSTASASTSSGTRVRWDLIAGAPTTARDHDDPAYDWRSADAVLRGLRRHGIQPLVTLYGTPRWANGGLAPNWAPTSPPDLRRLRARSRDALLVGRASGRSGTSRTSRSGCARRRRTPTCGSS